MLKMVLPKEIESSVEFTLHFPGLNGGPEKIDLLSDLKLLIVNLLRWREPRVRFVDRVGIVHA